MNNAARTTSHSDSASAEPAEPSSPAEERSAPSKPRWLLVALVVGYLLHVAWRIWLARNLDAPAAHADEDGYLVAARALTGGPGGVTTENDAFRRLGYPLLLSPIYLFTSDAFTVYKSVLVLNAFYNALIFPLAYLFANRVLGLSWRTALGVSFTAALIPAVVFYAEFALTDAVLAPIAMLWIVAAHHWITSASARGRLVGALGAGFTAGFFYVVHVRGTMIVGAHLLLIVALLLIRRTNWRLAAGSVLAIVAAAALDPVLKMMIEGDIVAAGRSPKSQTIDAITTLSGLGRMFGGANGQLWYFFMATLGLGAVGVIVAASPLRDLLRPRKLRDALADPDDGPRRIIALLLLATTLLIALTSSAALPPADNRLNYYSYPRYIHMLFPMWVMLGFAALLAARTVRKTLMLAAGAVALTGITGIIVYIRIQSIRKAAMFQPFDSPELNFLGWTWKAFSVVRPTAVAMLLFAGIIAAPLLARHPRVRAVAPWLRPNVAWVAVIVGFALVQTANMAMVSRRVAEKMVTFQYTDTTPRLVQDGYLKPDDKVAFAMRSQKTWFVRYNHMREVYWTPIVYFDQHTTPTPADADVVIAPYRPDEPGLHWDGSEQGFRLVVVAEEQFWAVWRRG